jgi:hypothetical protein
VRSPGALAVYYNAFDDEPASYDVVTGRVQLYDCQQSALFVSESIALQELATVAGGAMATAAIPMLKEQSAAMSARINGSLWDEETGIYRQRDASNQSRGFSPVLSPTSFYPMMAGIPSTAQAERMVANHLTNSSEFCVDPGAEFETETSVQGACPFAIPSISRDNPNFWDNTCVPVVVVVVVCCWWWWWWWWWWCCCCCCFGFAPIAIHTAYIHHSAYHPNFWNLEHQVVMTHTYVHHHTGTGAAGSGALSTCWSGSA